MKKINNQLLSKLSLLDKFMFKATGADPELLAGCSYPIRVMYFCLGGIVLSTGVLAFLSGSYAIYTVFAPKQAVPLDSISWYWVGLSTLIGSYYGYLIFNLERYIVSSTGKGDGTEDITWSELKNAMPRILLAVVIGITISKPIELRIFKSEIDAVLTEKRIAYRDRLRAGVDTKYEDRIEKVETEIEKLEEEIETENELRNGIQREYMEEARIVTVGPRARAMKAEELAKIAEIEELTKKQGTKETELNAILRERETERTTTVAQADNLDGILERIKISHEIGGWIPWFVTAVFVALDVTAIFFKMMLTKNTYDYLKENREKLILANNGIEVMEGFYSLDEEGNTVDKTTYHEADVVAEEKFGIFKRQKEIISKIISKYFDKESKRVDTNLEDFIKNADDNNEAS